jgi:hypothetical protein
MITLLRGRDTSTVQPAADAFLFSLRYVDPNTRRGYTGVLYRLLAQFGTGRPLADVSGEEMVGLPKQVLELHIEDLDLDARRTPIRSKADARRPAAKTLCPATG